jgi:hypothetical protein
MEPTWVKHLSDALLWDRLLSLPTNVRLCWKGLPWTNPSLLWTFLHFVHKRFYRTGLRTSQPSKVNSLNKHNLIKGIVLCVGEGEAGEGGGRRRLPTLPRVSPRSSFSGPSGGAMNQVQVWKTFFVVFSLPDLNPRTLDNESIVPTSEQLPLIMG